MGCVVIGDNVFMGPGMGISTASTSTRVTMCMNNIIRYTRELAGLVCDPDGQFQCEVRENASVEPKFRLCLTPMGLAVYEQNRGKAWVLPKKEVVADSNYIADLHDLLAPEWAVKQLVAGTHNSES